MIYGMPNFNAIALLEIDRIAWTGGHPVLTGHIAYVNSNNGKTYGQATFQASWSKETLALLDALRTSMETDISKLVFAEEATTAQRSLGNTETISGIGEELNDARQV